jgi:hypothetical protein
LAVENREIDSSVAKGISITLYLHRFRQSNFTFVFLVTENGLDQARWLVFSAVLPRKRDKSIQSQSQSQSIRRPNRRLVLVTPTEEQPRGQTPLC